MNRFVLSLLLLSLSTSVIFAQEDEIWTIDESDVSPSWKDQDLSNAIKELEKMYNVDSNIDTSTLLSLIEDIPEEEEEKPSIYLLLLEDDEPAVEQPKTEEPTLTPEEEDALYNQLLENLDDINNQLEEESDLLDYQMRIMDNIGNIPTLYNVVLDKYAKAFNYDTQYSKMVDLFYSSKPEAQQIVRQLQQAYQISAEALTYTEENAPAELDKWQRIHLILGQSLHTAQLVTKSYQSKENLQNIDDAERLMMIIAMNASLIEAGVKMQAAAVDKMNE